MQREKPLADQPTPAEVIAPAPRRRRLRWRIVLAAAAVLLVAFYLFVTLRGARDYRGELAALLPARTSGFAVLNDFDGIRRHIGQTRLYDELSNSIDLAALLMTNEDWRKYQENKDSVESKAKAALAREFLRRYFSQEVVVALARLDRCDEPALLVMARTDLGFAEKLGELCAQLYPELHLSSENYRGVLLYAYEAPQSKRSFTYVRFGKTVAISLLSNERDYLRRIIDYRLDGPAETLFRTDDFQRAWRSPARGQGLLLVARPTALIRDMLARPDFHLRDNLAKPGFMRIRYALSGFRFLQAAVTVRERIEIRFDAHPDPTTAPLTTLAPPTQPLAMLETVPSDSLGCVVLRYGNLADTLARILNIHLVFDRKAADPEALAEAVGRLNREWGLDINRDLAPALDPEMALVIHGVQLPMLVVASLMFPVADRPRAESAINQMLKNHASLDLAGKRPAAVPATFRQVPEFQPLSPTPLGFLGVGWLDRFCILGLSPDSYLAMKQMIERKGQPITRQPIFRSLGLPVGEPLDALAFVDLEEIGRRAEGLLAVLSLASKSVRQKSATYGKIVAVVKLLRGVGLYARHTHDDWTIVLRVPTQ